jgi:hypothetical protein
LNKIHNSGSPKSKLHQQFRNLQIFWVTFYKISPTKHQDFQQFWIDAGLVQIIINEKMRNLLVVEMEIYKPKVPFYDNGTHQHELWCCTYSSKEHAQKEKGVELKRNEVMLLTALGTSGEW